MEYRVDLCEAVPQAILRVPREIRPDRLGEDIASGMRELAAVAQRAGLTASGAPTLTYQHELPPDRTNVADFEVPVEPGTTLGPASGAEVVVLPGAQVARTCHRGSYDGLGSAYLALREWIHESGYRPCGPPTEAYLIGPDEVTDSRLLITEIRIPVVPSPVITVLVDAPVAEAVRRAREALRQQGFDLLIEIDMGTALRREAGPAIGDYVVLEVYHPQLASRALLADRQAGLLLPHNVVVRSQDDGAVVEVADPVMLVHATDQPLLRSIAEDGRGLLTAALQNVRAPAESPR